jgi:peptidoglycan hydrolase-like protein with peptidoglycan-binding domain
MTRNLISRWQSARLVLLAALVALTLAGPSLAPAPAAAGQYGSELGCGATASHRTIQQGNTGKSVRHLQCLLNNRGYDLAVDGVFGPKTARAVKDFQRDHGLTVDGIVGENTWYALHQKGFPDKPKAP